MEDVLQVPLDLEVLVVGGAEGVRGLQALGGNLRRRDQGPIVSNSVIQCLPGTYLDALLCVVAVLCAVRLAREELDEGEHEPALLLRTQRHPEIEIEQYSLGHVD